MLLTITHRGKDTQNLGYILFKNPNRPQEVKLNTGKAYVFYPKVSNEETTIALLVDINSLDLAKGEKGKEVQPQNLFDYVNDRPYAASSFLATAMHKVFGTAISGRGDEYQELADSKIDLTASIHMLPCPLDKEILNKIFQPLGYAVSYETFLLDEKFPQWGDSKYVNLNITGKVELKTLLKQIILLIPAFDRFKHYDIGGQDEINKLIKLGDGWLNNHPEKDFILARYLQYKKGLVNKAQEQFKSDIEVSEVIEDSDVAIEEFEIGEIVENEKKESLNTMRWNTVLKSLADYDVKSLLDLGCNNGKFLEKVRDKLDINKLAGTDISFKVISVANRKANKKDMSKIDFFHSSILYKDNRFKGYDAVTVIEVMEHIDKSKLYLFEKILFGYINPRIIILTTPNKDYNENYKNLDSKGLRHFDHRFEFTKEEFKNWKGLMCFHYHYFSKFIEIGTPDDKDKYPTLGTIFIKK